jgi:hypothetical protein
VSISSFWIGEGDREERKKEREGILYVIGLKVTI